MCIKTRRTRPVDSTEVYVPLGCCQSGPLERFVEAVDSHLPEAIGSRSVEAGEARLAETIEARRIEVVEQYCCPFDGLRGIVHGLGWIGILSLYGFRSCRWGFNIGLDHGSCSILWDSD